MKAPITMRTRNPKHSARLGALLSAELVFTLPIVMGAFFALVEISMLWIANHRLEAACRAAARVASIQGTDQADVQSAATESLGRPALVRSHSLRVERGRHSGDPVWVEVRVPMRAAAPDLFWFLGFSLEGRQLVAQCVMRRE